MSLPTYTNAEIHKLAEPIWMNIIDGSNQGDYKLFSMSFSEDLKQKITEERFRSQRNEFPLLTSLSKDIKFIDCIRRESGITVLWKQNSSKLAGEFLGQLTLDEKDGNVNVIAVSVY